MKKHVKYTDKYYEYCLDISKDESQFLNALLSM